MTVCPFPRCKLQFTVTRFFDQVLGASRLTLLGEVGYSHTGDLPSTDKVRYGRAPAFGIGKGCNPAVPPFSPASGNDCTDKGYVTSGAWGYRLLAALSYSNVFAGINLTPKVAFSHDVDGYSATGVFLEDRHFVDWLMNEESKPIDFSRAARSRDFTPSSLRRSGR